MKTAAAHRTTREHIPSVTGPAAGKEPARRQELGERAGAIHEERRSAQRSIYSVQALLDVLDTVECEHPVQGIIDLGSMIHILKGLIEDASKASTRSRSARDRSRDSANEEA